MERPSTHRVLETCVARGAAEAWLIAGRPPVLRFAEHVRELATLPPLASDDIATMVFEDLAPNLAAHFQNRGFCSFDYPCRWRDNARVRVFVVRHGDSTFATLTPDTPELQYSDDTPGGIPAIMGSFWPPLSCTRRLRTRQFLTFQRGNHRDTEAGPR